MPLGQLVPALSQEDPELPPSGEEINKNTWEPNQPWSQWAPTSLFSLRVSFNFLVCLSDHETLGMTPVGRETVPRISHAVSSVGTGGEFRSLGTRDKLPPGLWTSLGQGSLLHLAPFLGPMSKRAWLTLGNVIPQRIRAEKENGFSLSRPAAGWHSPEPKDPICINMSLRKEQK